MRKTLARDWAGKAAGRALRLGLGLLAGLALLTTTVATAIPPATFSAAVNYLAGANPHGVAVGDFNKDGHLDLAVANQNDSTVTVLLGDGKGGFAPAPGSPFSLPPGSGPIAIAVGDFNGDGNLDIVTANQFNSVSVLLGNGDGTFRSASTTSTGSISPNALAVGDLRGVGKLDVVVTDQLSASAGILLGNGDGTFLAPTTLALDSFPSAVVLADLRNSGKLDLAVATSGIGFNGNVDIFLNDGTGGFAPASPATVAVGPAPLAVAAGNFNGHMDLLVANSSNTVSVLLGNGSGGFTAASPVGVGSMPSAIVVGDFNVDGKLDFVTANNQDNTVSVVLGNGDGTFQPATALAADLGPIALAVGDFNGDKEPDLAVANQSSNDVSIFLNTTVVAPPPPPISVSVAPSTASVQANNSAQFSATVTNDSANNGVTWALTQSGIACSPACGSVSPANTASGAATTYIAPSSVPSPAAVTLTASSVSDSTKSASATITVTAPPPPISVSVAPSTASVQANNSAQFSATVTNDSANNGVTWALTQSGVACSPACGSVSPANTASGVATTYTAPASVPSPATVTLTASSVSDSTKSASATITVKAPPPPISVSVAPSTASVQVNNSAQFSATVTNDSANKGVAWRLTQSGIACSPACGSVSPASTASGVATTYMAPASVPSPATVTLTASSVSDSTKSASATITVTPPPNSAPTASIAPDPPITCAGPNGAMVTLSGSGSDPDGDTLSFTWFDEHMNVIGHTAIVTVLVPPGTHTFTLQVSDGHGNVTSASTQVTVVPDTTPPTLSVSLSPNVLWPPNNKLVPITAKVSASDNCTAQTSIAIALVSIWSTDRDDDKTDIVIQGSSFWLRASKGDEWRDRVYTVTYKATDAAGNTAKTSATVTVPHSQAYRRAGKKQGKGRLDKKDKD